MVHPALLNGQITPEYILNNVFRHTNYKSHDQQLGVYGVALRKHQNTIINMPTQAGKSLCYQIPALMRTEGLTIVFTPSLASIHNGVAYLQSLGINAVSFNSSTSNEDRDGIKRNITCENSTIRFLIITPEIFSEFGNAENGLWFKNLILYGNINYIVVDEAHKTIDSSETRKAFNELSTFRSLNLNIPWIALTTIDRNNESKIAEALNMENPLSLWSSSVRTNIFYDTCSNSSYEGESVLSFVNRMRENDKMPCGIIFCKLPSHVLMTENYFKRNGIEIGSYYGRMENKEIVLRQWFNQEFPILVATSESFGFGIHYNVPPVKFVIHIGMPDNLRSFYHESSRAGNQNNQGFSRVYRNVEYLNLPDEMSEFDKYYNSECRRQYIAKFFGEEIPKCGDMCDKCLFYNNNYLLQLNNLQRG